jgi:hypothetical protein
MDVASLVRHCVHAFCAGVPPSRRLDPRVTKLLQRIRESDDLRMSLESAAEVVTVAGPLRASLQGAAGLPFRRYMMWRKLTRAMLGMAGSRASRPPAHAIRFRRCGAPHAHVPADVRYTAVGADARGVLRNRIAVRGGRCVVTAVTAARGLGTSAYRLREEDRASILTREPGWQS